MVALALVACHDDPPPRPAPPPAPALTGACLEPDQCWDHPAGGDPAMLADICDNAPGARWIDRCPREGLVAGCKSPNKYDRRAPTRWFYRGTIDDVRRRCEQDGDRLVDAKAARLVP